MIANCSSLVKYVDIDLISYWYCWFLNLNIIWKILIIVPSIILFIMVLHLIIIGFPRNDKNGQYKNISFLLLIGIVFFVMPYFPFFSFGKFWNILGIIFIILGAIHSIIKASDS